VSISLKLESKGFEHVTGLCSNSGYALLCAWFDSLPEGQYPALAALSAAGSYKPTSALSDQLEAALAASPPTDPDAFEHANRLADLIGVGRKYETIIIEQ
jgi:hypothetical protein